MAAESRIPITIPRRALRAPKTLKRVQELQPIAHDTTTSHSLALDVLSRSDTTGPALRAPKAGVKCDPFSAPSFDKVEIESESQSPSTKQIAPSHAALTFVLLVFCEAVICAVLLTARDFIDSLLQGHPALVRRRASFAIEDPLPAAPASFTSSATASFPSSSPAHSFTTTPAVEPLNQFLALFQLYDDSDAEDEPAVPVTYSMAPPVSILAAPTSSSDSDKTVRRIRRTRSRRLPKKPAKMNSQQRSTAAAPVAVIPEAITPLVVNDDFLVFGSAKLRDALDNAIHSDGTSTLIDCIVDALAPSPFHMDLSADTQRLIDTPNAGGSSVYSEALSYELLKRVGDATLDKTEMEIAYRGSNTKKTDYTCTMDGVKLGVSVTRAMKFGGGDFTHLDARDLLQKKLEGIVYSSKAVRRTDRWAKQILHVWATGESVASTITKEYLSLSDELRTNTVLLLTVPKNAPWIFDN